jgi:hypothetical protein
MENGQAAQVDSSPNKTSSGRPTVDAVPTTETLFVRHDPSKARQRLGLMLLAQAKDEAAAKLHGQSADIRPDVAPDGTGGGGEEAPVKSNENSFSVHTEQADRSDVRSSRSTIQSARVNRQVAQSGNRGTVGPAPPVPAYRKEVFKNQSGTWDQWDKGVRALHDVGKNEAHAYREVFAAEGGFRLDPRTRSVKAGVTPGTLKTITPQLEKQGVDTSGGPRSIDEKDFPKVYRAILDEALKQVGGSKALEQIPDKTTAAALGDAIFRHGKTGGAQVFQRAINAISPGAVPIGTIIGPKTFPEIVRLAGDSKTRSQFLDAIAKQRKARVADQNEWTRFDHFR